MADQDNSILKAFGFELKRSKSQSSGEENKKLPSIVPKIDEDGAGYITASGSHFGQYVDMNGKSAKDNHQLIKKYRGIAEHPEVDAAIEEIINEAISGEEKVIEVKLDNIDTSDSIKKQIKNIIVDETIENVNSSSNGSNLSILDSDGFNERLNKVYEKFSDNLIRKIKEASKNGKDEKAIGIINQIFLDD